MTIPRTSPAPQLRRTAAVLACSVLAVGMVGCSSKDKTSATSTTTTTAKASPAVTAPPLPAEPTFSGTPAGAVVDVKIVDCPTDKGDQTAKLELTNSTKAARDYAVMVIWLKNDSGTPLGSGLVTAKAAEPGKKTPLTVKAKVVAKADKCVLNVRAGSLK